MIKQEDVHEIYDSLRSISQLIGKMLGTDSIHDIPVRAFVSAADAFMLYLHREVSAQTLLANFVAEHPELEHEVLFVAHNTVLSLDKEKKNGALRSVRLYQEN